MNVVRSEFFVTVNGHPHIALRHQFTYLFKSFAQYRGPIVSGTGLVSLTILPLSRRAFQRSAAAACYAA
jgi:hypothetical protein